MTLMYLVLLGAAILVTVVLLLIFALVGGWRSQRRGVRVGAFTVTVLLIVLHVRQVAVTISGESSPSTPMLHVAAPVPAGSGLYLAHDRGARSGGAQFTLVRASARTGAVEMGTHPPLETWALQGSDGSLYGANVQEAWALQGSDGEELWHTTLVSPWQSGATPPYLGVYQPVISDGPVYLTLANHNGRAGLIALRARDGKQLWSCTLDNYPASVGTEPLAAGGAPI